MERGRVYLLGVATALVCGSPAGASETIRYSYDALGRLVAVSTSGGPQSGRASSLCYDPAGNRAQYQSSAAGHLATCTPPPPPSSELPAGNHPPATANDQLSVPRCGSGTVNVVANDTDPEGNYPLVLVSVSGAANGAASVIDGATIEYTAADTTSAGETLTYTVRDSLGASSVGFLTVGIGGGQCD